MIAEMIKSSKPANEFTTIKNPASHARPTANNPMIPPQKWIANKEKIVIMIERTQSLHGPI